MTTEDIPVNVNDNFYDGDGINIKIILFYHARGFIVTPLGDDGKTPTVSSTNSIYNNPWTEESLTQNQHLFKNIATLLGKTHLKDAEGRDLRLNVLDIEDKAVYDKVAALVVDGRYFLDDMRKTTFVVKTRKKWGLHILWLSHEEHPPIGASRCKPGFKFEIKTDNSLGHSTLPPSRHRNDEGFHYQSIGHDELAILDGLYRGLLKALSNCLKDEDEKGYCSSNNNNNSCRQGNNNNRTLTDSEIDQLVELFSPHYEEGVRHNISVGLVGLCCIDKGISSEASEKLIEALCAKTGDKENRLEDVKTTYKKWYMGRPIEGASLLAEVLGNKTAEVLGKFHQILAQRETSINITHEGSIIKLDLGLGRCSEEITFVTDQDTMFNRIMEKVTSLGLTIDTFYLETRLKEIIRDYNFTHVPEEETGQTLDDDQIQQICKLIAPWRGKEEGITLVNGICSFLHGYDYSPVVGILLIQNIFNSKDEQRHRITQLGEVYKNTRTKGVNSLLKTLRDVIPQAQDRDVKKMLAEIVQILIGNQKHLFWLIDAMMCEDTFATMKDTDEMFYYDGGIYVGNGEWQIRQKLEVLYPSIRTSEMQEIITKIKSRTGRDRSEFDNDSRLNLNLPNGVLNIHTKELIPHSPDYLSLAQLPVSYRPETECPNILRFLKEVCRLEEVHVVLQMIGYCLYKSCEYEKSFMLLGRGANGKGTLLSLIEAFLGSKNCSHRSLQDLDQNRFAMADLYGKMANTFFDLKSTKLTETGNFKMITSGDSITGEHKHQHPFSFRNHAPLIFSANLVPESDVRQKRTTDAG